MSTSEAFPWCRLYVSMLDDDKMLLLADEDQMKFVKLLLLKRSGVLDSSAPYRDRRIAAKLRLSEEGLADVKRRLMEVGLIDENYQPLAWEKRQFAGDQSGAERMRRHRANQRNVTVTSPCDKSDVLETESDIETESDTEKDTSPLSGGSAEGGTARERASPRPTKRMPGDYEPSAALRQQIATECPLVDFESELRVIRDHEFGIAHKDWDATVRNWMRREQKQQAQRRGPRTPLPPRESRFQAMTRRLSEI